MSGSSAGSASARASTGHTYLVGTEDYLPGRAADLYLPDNSGPSPLVVMVPGGAWLTAERGGLAPLAEALARDGVSVVNATHRAVDQGGRFPQMVADVLCSVSWAVARVTALRAAPSPVVLLGHSSGAHLAALAALGPADLATGCPYPPAHIDGLVGLSGTYDVSQLVDLATPFFGASPGQDPDAWRAGNPLTWAGAAGASPLLPVLLAHGGSDTTLPVAFTEQFAATLRAAGHPVEVELVAGADHHSIYSPAIIAPTVLTWLRTFVDQRSTAQPGR